MQINGVGQQFSRHHRQWENNPWLNLSILSQFIVKFKQYYICIITSKDYSTCVCNGVTTQIKISQTTSSRDLQAHYIISKQQFNNNNNTSDLVSIVIQQTDNPACSELTACALVVLSAGDAARLINRAFCAGSHGELGQYFRAQSGLKGEHCLERRRWPMVGQRWETAGTLAYQEVS